MVLAEWSELCTDQPCDDLGQPLDLPEPGLHLSPVPVFFGENPITSFIKRALHGGNSQTTVEQRDNGDISRVVTCGLLSLRGFVLRLLPRLGRRANVSGGLGGGPKAGSECPGKGTLSSELSESSEATRCGAETSLPTARSASQKRCAPGCGGPGST